MPRLFTGLEIPADVAQALSMMRGGLPGARWIDPENYHVTLRFIGDVDDAFAHEIASLLDKVKRRGFDRDSIHALRKAYRLLFATEEGTLKERTDEVAAMFPNDVLVEKVVAFIRAGGERAICVPKPGRDG